MRALKSWGQRTEPSSSRRTGRPASLPATLLPGLFGPSEAALESTEGLAALGVTAPRF